MEKSWISKIKQLDETLTDEQKTDLLEMNFSCEVHFEDEEDFLSWSQEQLPTAICEESSTLGCTLLSIFSYNRPSQKLEIFLFDIIRTWLLSDGLQLRSFACKPFTLEKHPDLSFLMAKFLFETTRKNDIEKIRNHIPLILKEITLYLSSSKHAETLLNSSASKQELYFHEALIQLLHRWPDDFEEDLIQDYQHFIGVSEKEFRNHRSGRHQLRLLSSLYLMRKKLMRKIPLAPQEIHLEMRLLPTCLQFPFSHKQVVGIAVAISLPSPYERFEDYHILLAVQKLIPWTQAIKESFLAFQKPHTSLRLLYLEVEKNNGIPFSLTERALLKKQLSIELKKCVETLSPSIFGNCDVEEIMRSIFLLSQESIAPYDIPQVMISFEGSSGQNLIFRIIVIWIGKKKSKPFVSYFQALEEDFEYIPERSSIIGYIGKKTKEAIVFRLHLPKSRFLLRLDSSLNLYRARQYVHSLLVKALGEVRDYNGGIFAKQLELYSQFKQLFEGKDSELLEDFFHALNPPEMQAILPLSVIATLFQLFLQVLADPLPKEESYLLHTQEKDELFFAVIRLKDSSFQEKLTLALIEAKIFHEIQAWTFIKRYDGLVLGYITHVRAKKNQLFETLRQTLEQWAAEKQRAHIFRLDIQDWPVSLDPRLGGDDMSGILLKMLFEGLMRFDQQGKLTFAIAENVDISNEGQRYSFALKESYWNNGEPVTAHDFCYAWKKILSPSFKTPFAYLFYAIKNAKMAKNGKLSLDEVGIYTPDPRTLIVELEHPCSYFLELTANPLYSPVNHRIDCMHPNWPLQSGQDYVCNGPFYLESINSRKVYILQKNSAYWDASSVELSRIQITKTSARKALELFKKGEIDWLGRPSRPWELFFSEQCQRPIEKLSASVVCWCACNVQQAPFQSSKLRLALAYALDRHTIVKRLPSGRAPAFTPLPSVHTQQYEALKCYEREKAKILFDEALQELGINRRELPSLTLIHANNEVRKEMAHAIVSQWKEVLGITVHTESYDFRDLFTKMTKGDYQLGLMMWRTWVDDPLYTLNAFRYSTEQINFSKWEDAYYQQLIDQAMQETDLKRKTKLIEEAEAILIAQMPVIPIAYEAELFSRADYIEGAIISKIGNIDFKNVRITKRTNIEKIEIFRSS